VFAAAAAQCFEGSNCDPHALMELASTKLTDTVAPFTPSRASDCAVKCSIVLARSG